MNREPLRYQVTIEAATGDQLAAMKRVSEFIAAAKQAGFRVTSFIRQTPPPRPAGLLRRR